MSYVKNLYVDNTTTTTEIRLEDSAGDEYIGINAATVTTTYSLTLPALQGGNGDVLRNNGSGVMSWNSTGVDGPAVATDNGIVRYDGTTGKLIQDTSGLGISDTFDLIDANANELINFTAVVSAVNEIGVTNAAAGDSPMLSATGDDININLEFLSKGTGVHVFDSSGANVTELRIYDIAGNDYVGIKPNDTTTSYTVTMPATQGAAQQVLQNNGAGVLDWVDNGLYDDETFAVFDNSDATKLVEFELAGATTATTTTLAVSQTVNRTITFPDTTDTLIARNTTDILTNKTLTSPIINEILDVNANEIVILETTASAINELTITNAAIGDGPLMRASGGDTNINMEFVTKGTGAHIFDSSGANATELRIYDVAGNDYIGIKPNDTTTSYALTMPPTQGATDQVLTNDGAGNMSWTVPKIPYEIQTRNGNNSTTSLNYVLLDNMEITPGAGTYLITFSASSNITVNNTKANYAIHIVDNVPAIPVASIIQHTERDFRRGNQNIRSALHTQSVETISATDSIAIYFKTDAGTINIREKSLILIRLA